MRHARQRQGGNLAPDIQVHHHAGFGLAVGADQVAVIRAEEEVVQRRRHRDPPPREQAALDAHRLLHAVLVGMDEAFRIGAAVFGEGDFPDFRHVLQRQHEGAALRGLIDRRHPAGRAIAPGHRHHPGDRQIGGGKHGQRRGQVVRHRQPFAIGADGDVAAVQPARTRPTSARLQMSYFCTQPSRDMTKT